MTSREDFEAWCESQGKYAPMEYSAWVVWQAATERAVKMCDDARHKIWEYHEPSFKRAAENVCGNLAAAIRGVT